MIEDHPHQADHIASAGQRVTEETPASDCRATRQTLFGESHPCTFGHCRQIEKYKLQVWRALGHGRQERAFATTHIEQAPVLVE